MPMNFSNQGYDGSLFGDFHVRRESAAGPGWFIYGRNRHKYGVNPDGTGHYVMLCGYRREGAARHYNGKVRIGWRTKKEAQAVLSDHLASYPALNSQGQ